MGSYMPLFDVDKLKSQLPSSSDASAFFTRTRLWIAAGLGAGLVLVSIAGYAVTAGSYPHDGKPGSDFYAATSHYEPNPFTQPGYLDYPVFRNGTGLDTNWIPFDESISPAPNWIDILRTAAGLPWPEIAGQQATSRSSSSGLSKSQAINQISHLQKTTILVIGDSVDRNLILQTSELLGVRDRVHAGHYENIHDQDPRDWDVRGLPHVLHLDEPNVDFTLANCFIYGMDEHDEFSKQPDWHAPGLAEERIGKLCKSMTNQLAHPPSLIQLHSGLWDCSYFGRIDRRNPDPEVQKSEHPLTKEQLQWWMKRMVQVIREIKKTWPGVPIVFRKLHRTKSPHEAWQWTSGQENLGFTNWFVDVRVAQIRGMQEEVAKSEGLRIFDFGNMWEGYQDQQDGVHPRTMPGGAIMSRALLHYAYLAYHER